MNCSGLFAQSLRLYRFFRPTGKLYGAGLFRRGPSPRLNVALLQLDFNVYASGQVEFHQSVYRFIGRVDDVHQTLVGTDFELVAAGFVDVR